MSSLRTRTIEPLFRLGRWDYVKRFGQLLGKTVMRHDLLVRTSAGIDELMLVVVSEHSSRKVALNARTFYEADAARARGQVKAQRLRMTVLLAQEPYQLLVDSVHLRLHLRNVHLVDGDKPSGYWPLTVGLM